MFAILFANIQLLNTLANALNFLNARCYTVIWGFPGGSEVKVSACNAGDLGSIPGSGRGCSRLVEIKDNLGFLSLGNWDK